MAVGVLLGGTLMIDIVACISFCFLLGWPMLWSVYVVIYLLIRGRLCKNCGHKHKMPEPRCFSCGEYNKAFDIFDGDD